MAQEVAQIYLSLWKSRLFKKLRSLGKRDAMTLAVYLLTNSNANTVGIFQFNAEEVAEETLIQREMLQSCLEDLAAYDYLTFDKATSTVWVHPTAWYQHNLGFRKQLANGDKRAEGVKRMINDADSDVLAELFRVRYNSALRMGFHKTHLRGEAEIRREAAHRLIGPSPSRFEDEGVL